MNNPMKRLLTTIILSAALVVAEPPSVQFAPVGPWALCQYVHFSDACDSATPNIWQLLIKPSHASAAAFRYSITITTADGSTRALTGAILRADNLYGYTAHVIYPGAVAKVVSVVVDELGVIE